MTVKLRFHPSLKKSEIEGFVRSLETESWVDLSIALSQLQSGLEQACKNRKPRTTETKQLKVVRRFIESFNDID